jgi:mono/diheme cytochrome c family protein
MIRRAINIAMLILLILMVIGYWTLSRDYTGSRSTVPFLDEMYTSPALESQHLSDVHNQARIGNRPPEGTVPRGAQPFHYDATPEDAARAGRDLSNPFDASDEVLARGRVAFENYCSSCHGPRGEGDGGVAARSTLKPNSLLRADAKKIPDGTLYHIITLGQGNMPEHASIVEPDDRWKIISYIRSLQKQD